MFHLKKKQLVKSNFNLLKVIWFRSWSRLEEFSYIFDTQLGPLRDRRELFILCDYGRLFS